jgi:hypothetical protein
MIPTQQSFERVNVIGFQNHQRLVVQFNCSVASAKVHFQFARYSHARIHFRLKKPEGAAPVGLGVIQRHVRIPQQLVRLDSIHRRN